MTDNDCEKHNIWANTVYHCQIHSSMIHRTKTCVLHWHFFHYRKPVTYSFVLCCFCWHWPLANTSHLDNNWVYAHVFPIICIIMKTTYKLLEVDKEIYFMAWRYYKDKLTKFVTKMSLFQFSSVQFTITMTVSWIFVILKTSCQTFHFKPTHVCNSCNKFYFIKTLLNK